MLSLTHNRRNEKTTLRYYFSPIKQTKIENFDTKHHRQGCEGNCNSHAFLIGIQNNMNPMGKNLTISSKIPYAFIP